MSKNKQYLGNIESNLRNEISQVGIHGRSRQAIKTMFKNRKELKKQAVEQTAKYFGISMEKAAEMLKQSDKRNAETRAKGLALNVAVQNGKTLRGGVAL